MYCVYLTTYSGNKLPPFYIGSSSLQKISNGYLGSVSSHAYRNIFKTEVKLNPHLFKTHVISTHASRAEALEKEKRLQIAMNVVRSPMYINKSIAAPAGFFGMDVSGKNNPNYGNKWTPEQRAAAARTAAKLHEEGILKPPPIKYGTDNGRHGDNRTTYVNSETGEFVFASKFDPHVISGQYIHMASAGKTNVEKAKLTKRKNKNIRKYEYIILKTPSGDTIRLEHDEYGEYIRTHQLSNMISAKRVKGYILIEAKLNPDCKVSQPIKQKSKLRNTTC